MLCFWSLLGFYTFSRSFIGFGEVAFSDFTHFLRYIGAFPGENIFFLVSLLVYLLVFIFVGKRVFRKATQYKKEVTDYFYGENAKAGDAPLHTLEELEERAAGNAFAHGEEPS